MPIALRMLMAAPVVAIFLFVGMLVLLELGRRLGKRHLGEGTDAKLPGGGAADTAVFGLMGLLVAFTFSGAASRFDTRRTQIAQEANSIRTAWYRIDIHPEDYRPELRSLFRTMLDARIETYRVLPDLDRAMSLLVATKQVQDTIWNRAVAGCEQRNDAATRTLLLGSLNAMFDITTTRTAAARSHPPLIIYYLLIILALGAAFLAGYGMAGHRTRPTIHMVGFAAAIALTTYVILDVEFPRAGLVRLDEADRILIELREEMK